MAPNKYAELNKSTGDRQTSKNQHESSSLQDAAGSTSEAQTASSSVIPSEEYTVPIFAHMSYRTDMESDGFVRIYDGVVAQRDDVFLVSRKELIGKTPAQIQEHFSLSFLPRMLCDASIPIGHQVTAGKLTNAAGKQVYVFKALTALELSSERPLTPENISPVRLKSTPQAAGSKPSVPQQPPILSNPQTSEGFGVVEAQEYLGWLLSEEKSAIPIPPSGVIEGPDGFPYLPITIGNASSGGDVSAIQQPKLPSLQNLLNEGYGLVLWRAGEDQPFWTYKYRDILCFKLFNSLRPPAEFDETLYADTLDKPIPSGSRIMSGTPSEQIFPTYVRNVLNRRIGAALGRGVSLKPTLIQYPDVDTLRRFKLNLSMQGVSEDVRKKVGLETYWYLPYVVYF